MAAGGASKGTFDSLLRELIRKKDFPKCKVDLKKATINIVIRDKIRALLTGRAVADLVRGRCVTTLRYILQNSN